MRAKLKRLQSPDVDLRTFWPEDEKSFAFLLEAYIGPESENGEESFGIQVCTPRWLESHRSEDESIFGYHMLIVFSYDLSAIEAKIVRFCDRCVGEDWQQIAQQLARIGQWEYESYRPLTFSRDSEQVARVGRK